MTCDCSNHWPGHSQEDQHLPLNWYRTWCPPSQANWECTLEVPLPLPPVFQLPQLLLFPLQPLYPPLPPQPPLATRVCLVAARDATVKLLATGECCVLIKILQQHDNNFQWEFVSFCNFNKSTFSSVKDELLLGAAASWVLIGTIFRWCECSRVHLNILNSHGVKSFVVMVVLLAFN